MNGDLLTTTIKVANGDEKADTHGMFYSIVEDTKVTPTYKTDAE
jgi:hypothetical protein